MPTEGSLSRNPFRTVPRPHNTPDRSGNVGTSTSSSDLLSGPADLSFYGSTSFNQAQGNIVHIHNQTNHTADCGSDPNSSSTLDMGPSPPYAFPLQGSEAAVCSPADTYMQLLMCQGHGYPLWNPKPPDDLPIEYTSAGVRIGDVGVVTSDGVFDYAFNIYYSAEHPINRGRTPPNFVPLSPRASIRGDINKWKRGSYIVSPGIRGLIRHEGSYSFSCHASEGAALALPDGASREDARDLANLRDYAAQYAIGWYQDLILRRRWEVRNGSLYLVTGCDKTSTWGTAAFSARSRRSFRMVFSPPGREFDPAQPAWGESGCAETNSGHSGFLTERSHCVFLRGFKATLQPRLWAELSYAVEISSISEISRSLGDYFSKCISFLPVYLWFLRWFGPEETLKRSLLDTYHKSLPLHPPEIVNLDILRRVPAAKLALTHDSIYWWPKISLDTWSPPNSSHILTQVFDENNIRIQGDVVYPIAKDSQEDTSTGLVSTFTSLWRTIVSGDTIIAVDIEDDRLLAESPRSSSPGPGFVITHEGISMATELASGSVTRSNLPAVAQLLGAVQVEGPQLTTQGARHTTVEVTASQVARAAQAYQSVVRAYHQERARPSRIQTRASSSFPERPPYEPPVQPGFVWIRPTSTGIDYATRGGNSDSNTPDRLESP